MRDLHVALRSVVAVENLLNNPAHGAGFFHEQMRLRIEKELVFHARGGGRFNSHGVLSIHQCLADESDSQLVLLYIEQATVSDLPFSLHLDGIVPKHRSRAARRLLPPGGLPVICLDKSLAADDQF